LQKINGELNNVLGNLANRVFAFAEKNFAGKIEPVALSGQGKEELAEANELYRQMDDGYRDYQVKKNSKLGMDLARLGNRWFDDRKPWARIKTDRAHVQETLYVCATLLRLVSVALYPIIPKSMNRLRAMLGLEAASAWEEPDLGHAYALNETQPLFAKIEDAAVEAELEALRNSSRQGKEEISYEQIKEQVSYDDFARLDLRVATILQAERVPKTDKLLHLKVDIGSEQRELVAGIAEYYQPEEVVGKQVLMLVNLEPRKIRGIESRGMILAVHSEGKLHLVIPQNPCSPGSTAK
jgi:methionyl-tRNA synthetase